ncbi:MAG: hypothetical protein WKG06_32635 [Segetibacter sp.]
MANVLYAQQPHEMQDYTVIKQSKWIIPHNDTLAYAFSTYQSEKALDEQHYEALYFRPGYSGTINAVQYMPEKNLGLTGGIMRIRNIRLKLSSRSKHGFMLKRW